jgi:hypothetical protein
MIHGGNGDKVGPAAALARFKASFVIMQYLWSARLRGQECAVLQTGIGLSCSCLRKAL